MTEPTVKHLTTAALALLLVLGAGCVRASAEREDAGEPTPSRQEIERMVAEKGLERATFAGGCFWCMEPPFEKLDGVHAVISGYTGGPEVDPSYDEVSSGRTGHREAVVVLYDPQEIGYETLLHVFWRQIDPTDAGGQFADRGSQYETAIFYHDQEQKRLAEESKRELAASGPFGEPLVTPILAAEDFYPAEEYHQDYYEKNPSHYKRYRKGSGREGFLERTWGGEEKSMQTTAEEGFSPASFEKPSDQELRQRLTDIQYQVTQQDGTERPFDNEYWDNKQEGIYVDVVSGEPLFSSKDKYKSGTGWPSFSRPLEPENIATREDRKMLMKRTEVRSKHADSHLGHVFEDGPAPTGLRYCMNSASLRFIPADRLEEEGYGEYAHLFEDDE